MSKWVPVLAWALMPALGTAIHAQQARQIVQQAVRAELAAAAADHSLWLYYEVDQKPGGGVVQWVAQTHMGELDRVLKTGGRRLPPAVQQKRMNDFIQNSAAQARQRVSGQHDDKQTTAMLNMLPNAFIWSITSEHDGNTYLHFQPDPNFHPPTWESRVFAAMEGNMEVNDAQHRIVSLRGRMVSAAKFAWGLLGELEPGGTFDVERRELAPDIWQITQTHVHIQGHALIFKNISEQEDDVKSRFVELPQGTTLQEAEEKLLQER